MNPNMTGQPLDPLEMAVSNDRTGLEDLKSLLEDRGEAEIKENKDTSVNTVRRSVKCGVRCCSRLKTMLFLLVMVVFDATLFTEARSSGKFFIILNQYFTIVVIVFEETLSSNYKLF